MRIPSLHYILPLLFRVGLGALFLWSGIGKWTHLGVFYGKVADYHILPDTLAFGYGALLPWIEILAGIYLLIGLFIRFSALLTVLMLVSFLIAIITIMIRGDQVDCGCFIGGGPNAQPSYVGWPLLIRDCLMLAAAGYLCWRGDSPWSLDRWLKKG